MKKLIQAWRGAKLLRAWFERGGETVGYAKATERAKICVACPMNRRGGLFNLFTRALADWAKAGLIDSAHNSVPFSAFDHRIHTCKMCGCALRIMVQTPIDVLAMHKSVDEIEKLPHWCWVKQELDA